MVGRSDVTAECSDVHQLVQTHIWKSQVLQLKIHFWRYFGRKYPRRQPDFAHFAVMTGSLCHLPFCSIDCLCVERQQRSRMSLSKIGCARAKRYFPLRPKNATRLTRVSTKCESGFIEGQATKRGSLMGGPAWNQHINRSDDVMVKWRQLQMSLEELVT